MNGSNDVDVIYCADKQTFSADTKVSIIGVRRFIILGGLGGGKV